ncbi:MAG: hypothetical protein A4E45_01614 [Methanosaeta sp. PtaB.Bin039]|nr:MAG: hypothetical protein A4E45_01614 [Methanosaeta sp. PtaB.Bin039]
MAVYASGKESFPIWKAMLKRIIVYQFLRLGSPVGTEYGRRLSRPHTIYTPRYIAILFKVIIGWPRSKQVYWALLARSDRGS